MSLSNFPYICGLDGVTGAQPHISEPLLVLLEFWWIVV